MKYLTKIAAGSSLGLLAIVSINVVVAKILGNSLLITTWPVVAHLLAFPFVVCTIMASAGLVMVAILCWRKRKIGTVQRFWVTFAIVSIVTGLLYGSLVLGPTLSLDSSQTQRGEITVFEWNAHDIADADQFEDIFAQFDPDVLVLPELGDYPTDYGTRLSNLLDDAGKDSADYSIFTSQSQGGIAPVTIMLKNSLGEYTVQNADLATFGSLVLTPSNPDSDLPVIIGLHTAPPLPGLMDSWKDDLKLIQSHLSYSNYSRAIIAGDFNAQLYHGALASLTKYYEIKPSILGGTWPRSAAPIFRSQIDHILISDTCSVRVAQYYETRKSDHVALVSILSFN